MRRCRSEAKETKTDAVRKRPMVECDIVEYDEPSQTWEPFPAHKKIMDAISTLIENGETYGRPTSVSSSSALAIYFGDAMKAGEVATKVMFQDANTTEGSICKVLGNLVRGVHTGHLEDYTWRVHSVRPSGKRTRDTFFVFRHAVDLV